MNKRVLIIFLFVMFGMYGCKLSLGDKECQSDNDCPLDMYCGSEGICIPLEQNGNEDVGGETETNDAISVDAKDIITSDTNEDIVDIGYDVGDVGDVRDVFINDIGDVVIDIGDTGKDVGWDINDVYDAGADVRDISDVSDISDVCTPNCNNKECGSNGCGGYCGLCGNNSYCSDSTFRCECSIGFENCNNNWNDGCEVNLNSTNSCGTSCSDKVVCSSANGSNPVCDKGVCKLTCDGGYVDCNAKAGKSDGCETKADTGIMWDKGFGGTDRDIANALYVDESGYIYITGSFYSGTINFDSKTLQKSGNYSNGYLVKIDANGNVLWAKGFSATGENSNVDVTSVITDSNYEVYIAGTFSGILDLDGHSYTSQGGSDIFMAKYNSSGNYQWSKSFGTIYDDTIAVLGIDLSDNSIYLTGSVGGPGANFGDKTLSNGGVFLAKFDSAGTHKWSKDFGGLISSTSIAIDSQHSIIITGGFESDIKFDGTNTLPKYGQNDIFLAKFDSNGNHKWSKSFGGSKDDVAYSVAVDGNNNIYITGGFRSDKISFDNGTSYLNNYNTDGKSDIFIAKFDLDGNHSLSKSFGGDEDDWGRAITVNNNDIYITGNFSSTQISIGGNILVNNDQANKTSDIFLAKFDDAYTFRWSKSFGGKSNDFGTSLLLKASALYVTGYFGPGPIVFKGCPQTNSGTGDYSYDIFLLKHYP